MQKTARTRLAFFLGEVDIDINIALAQPMQTMANSHVLDIFAKKPEIHTHTQGDGPMTSLAVKRRGKIAALNAESRES